MNTPPVTITSAAVSFYGTGISGRSSLTNVNVTVDGVKSVAQVPTWRRSPTCV